MNNDIYKKSFSLFLRRTDEKSVIKHFIRDNIPIVKKIDFLDIGGGDGSLTSVISKEARTTLVVEPNHSFNKELSTRRKIKVLNEKWENIQLNNTFDFILAAYVITYFPKNKIRRLIRKMYALLRPGGYILILSVDARMGSWRKVHTYFYKLISRKHHSSDITLSQIARKYKAVSKSFKTKVISKDVNEMLDILKFDFHKYPKDYSKYSRKLITFLNRYADRNGKIALEMVHNAYIITKK